jgi:hypothetical protein
MHGHRDTEDAAFHHTTARASDDQIYVSIRLIWSASHGSSIFLARDSLHARACSEEMTHHSSHISCQANGDDES